MDNNPICTQQPYPIQMNLVVRAYLNDINLGTPQQQWADIPFTGIITDPCANNAISFSNTISTLDYWLSTPAVEFPYQPTLVATNPICEVVCRLVTMPGEADYPTSVVMDFSPTSLATVIRATNKSFSGLDITLAIQCVAPANTEGTGRIINEFTISFYDDCARSQLTAPSMGDYSVALYDSDMRGFSTSQNSKQGCNPITYALYVVSPNNAPGFALNSNG